MPSIQDLKRLLAQTFTAMRFDAESVALGPALETQTDRRLVGEPSADTPDSPNLNLGHRSSSTSTSRADLAAAQVAALPPAFEPRHFSSTLSVKPSSGLGTELADMPLFEDLDPSSLRRVIGKVRVVSLEAGQVLFREGDAANSLYVIVEGAVVPIAEGELPRKLAVLERGEFFGEIALMARQPRNATIKALVETKLLAIDRRALWELIDIEPSLAQSILRFLRARLIDRQIRTNLFFATFAFAEREAIARQFRLLELQDDTRLVEQGKPAKGLFLVLAGSLSRIDRAENKEIGSFGLGDVFGGLSLLEGLPSPSDVVARGKCWLVVLGEGRFRRILEANPRLIRIIRRLASQSQGIGEFPGVSAL